MTRERPFPEDPDETRVEILQATDAALREHGYAALTIDRIGAEFSKSKSLLYHHYDGKDDLLTDYLTYLLDTFDERMGCADDADPHARLTRFLDGAFDPTVMDEGLKSAIVELRAQGASDPEYRRHLTDHDRLFREHVADIVADGVESGVYRDVDPEQVAAMIHAISGGAMTQSTTSEEETWDAVRAELEAYFRERLLADGR
jgi:AcrR family transcriptional regulator